MNDGDWRGREESAVNGVVNGWMDADYREVEEPLTDADKLTNDVE